MHFILLLALVISAFMTPNMAKAEDLSPGPKQQGLQEYEDQVSYIVSGIISYSRWPEGTRPSKACIVGSTRYIKALLAQNDSNNTYAWQYFQENNYSDLEGCEIIYIGSLNASEMDSLLLRIIGRPVLSITENDPHCDGGSLICLSLVETRISFQVNLDAVARSGIRIHPQVLKLGREL